MTLVVIAILVAIAVPSYRNHVCKVERNQAKADLESFAQKLESFYSANNFKYRDSDGNIPNVFPSHSPAQRPAQDRRYTLAAQVPASNDSFVLTAERVAGSCEQERFTLANTGLRQWIKGGVTVNDWGK